MIYWLTTNLWSTGQGIVTRTKIPKPPPTEKRTPRTPAKEPPTRARTKPAATGEATRSTGAKDGPKPASAHLDG